MLHLEVLGVHLLEAIIFIRSTFNFPTLRSNSKVLAFLWTVPQINELSRSDLRYISISDFIRFYNLKPHFPSAIGFPTGLVEIMMMNEDDNDNDDDEDDENDEEDDE